MPAIVRLFKQGEICPRNAYGEYNKPGLAAMSQKFPSWKQWDRYEFMRHIHYAGGNSLLQDVELVIWRDEPESNEYGEVAP